MKNDDLGNRMKENYEERSRTYLTRRTPVIIRLDGCHFHTFTKGFKKPFDKIFVQTMQDTMKYLCEHIQGCVLGYTQSDEITLVLNDYANFNTSAWFDYQVQKWYQLVLLWLLWHFFKIFVRILWILSLIFLMRNSKGLLTKKMKNI